MASTINLPYISSIILAVLAIHATNAAAAAKMKKFNPVRFQPGKVHKIIGGTPATLGEIPYQVEILINNNFWCGGSLVTNKFVVTAAHCLDGVQQNELNVRAGHISHLNPGSTAQTKAVNNIKVHEMWNPQTSNRNDIAILELSSAMQINQFVKTIEVPCQECPVGATVNQILLASGWGVPENGDPVLMKVNMKVLSQTQCNELLGGELKSGQICARSTNVNGTCLTGRGGPLATKSGVITLVGVTAIEGCKNVLPTIFTRVHEYSDWIETNTT